MIDYLNEIFNTLAQAVREAHEDIAVSGEYTRQPSRFPMVTLDETANVTASATIDSSDEEKYAALSYRLQVFSNKQSGKKAEARAIFASADAVMRGMGFRRMTYSTTPEIYESTIYSITATYEAVVDVHGVTYKP